MLQAAKALKRVVATTTFVSFDSRGDFHGEISTSFEDERSYSTGFSGFSVSFSGFLQTIARLRVPTEMRSESVLTLHAYSSDYLGHSMDSSF